MDKSVGAKTLALKLCYRSTCLVRVGAVLHDNMGIFAWGWNHVEEKQRHA